MTDKDQLHHFLFDDCDLRGEIVTLGTSYREVLSHNPLPPAPRRLLGEFLTAASLLSSTLKFEGKIILQARGNGPLGTIMAECTHHQTLRGIVRINPEQPLDEQLAQSGSLQQLIGEGVLVITLEPQRSANFGGKLERYQGIVPLEADNLAGCLEAYFLQSEQLPTRLWFGVDNNTATGLLLQALPQQIAGSEHNQDRWENHTTLADTLSNSELCELEHADLLHRLYHQEPLRLFPPKPLQFGCSCSRQRSADALLTLEKKELEELLSEQGKIDIDCQFCNQHYSFSPAEVRQLLAPPALH